MTTAFGRHAIGRLERDTFVWLTTIGRCSGAPVPSVVWFSWTGAEVVILSQPGKAKLRNIEENPRVALNLETARGGDDVVVLSGDAVHDRAGMRPDEWAAYLSKYAERIERIGFATPDAFRAEYSELIRVTPRNLRGFF